MTEKFKILQMVFHVVTHSEWRFAVVNCLKEALQGVCAAGCWLEEQQDMRMCGIAGRGWWLCMVTLQVVSCKGLGFVGLRGCF